MEEVCNRERLAVEEVIYFFVSAWCLVVFEVLGG